MAKTRFSDEYRNSVAQGQTDESGETALMLFAFGTNRKRGFVFLLKERTHEKRPFLAT